VSINFTGTVDDVLLETEKVDIITGIPEFFVSRAQKGL
jgi:hypothetical protein